MMQMQAAQAIFWHRTVEMCGGWSIDAMWYIRASWSLSIFPGFKRQRDQKAQVTCVAIPPCYFRHAKFFLIAGAAVL